MPTGPIAPSENAVSTQVHEYTEAHRKLVGQYLGACLVAQRTYGKQGQDIGSITRIFCGVLNEFPPEVVVQAIKAWITKSPDFPTPYDIYQMLAPELKFDALVYRQLCDKRQRGDVLSWREEEYLKKYKENVLKDL